VPSHREGVAHVLPGGLRLTPVAHDVPSPTPDDYIVAFELRAESARANGKFISSWVAGLGKTRPQALRQAFAKTIVSTFHVLLDALSDHTCAACQTDVEHWTGREAAWTVHAGALLTQHSGTSVFTDTYVMQAWPALRQLFEQTQTEGVHWISVFISGFQNALQEIDVLLDNEPWPEANALLACQPWQPVEAFGSARHFALAMPRLIT
jgi:hypothetical protein